MISALRNGGVKALVAGWLTILLAKLFWFSGTLRINSPVRIDHLFGSLHLPVLPVFLAVILLLLVQAYWFNSSMNREIFFEKSNPMVLFGFLLVNILHTDQLLALPPMLLQTVFIFIMHRLLTQPEEEQGREGVFLDCGTAFGIGLILYPGAWIFLPFVLLFIRLFSVFNLYRLLLFGLAVIMVLAAGFMLDYLFTGNLNYNRGFFTPVPLGEWSAISKTPIFKSAVVFTLSLLGVLPFIFGVIGQSQIRHRKLMYALWSLFFLGLILLGTNAGRSDTQFLAMPLSLTWAVAGNRAKRPLLANLALLGLLWALLVIQWSVF